MSRRWAIGLVVLAGAALCVALILAAGLSPADRPNWEPVFGGIPLAVDSTGALTTDDFVVLPSRTFVVGYDNARMDPLWVSYSVTAPVQSGSGRSRPWKTDARTTARVSDDDFKYTEGDYDRGHMAPKAAMYRSYGQSAVDDTYTLTNACPQRHAFNDGVWGDLEDLVREEYSVALDEVWVVCGPVFDDSNRRAVLVKDRAHANLPQKPVEVPDAFYCILVDLVDGAPRALAFLIDHGEGYSRVNAKTRLSTFLVSIDRLEQLTGLDFFWSLDDAIEDPLESAPAMRMW
ncbi:MAG: DNA/RNA non-specific endonuclease [Candidatus Bipolaricaulota bacterium]|nr:DNA/RNA non-specific endonuclease [Candidatus Bipolaricaulota bacterium]